MISRVGIRADGGHDIGLGHVMRTVALAEEFVAKGWDAVFVSAGSGVPELLHSRGFSVLQAEPGASSLPDDVRFDVVVLDGYHFDEGPIVAAARAAGALVVAVDDRPGAFAGADVVVAPDLLPGTGSTRQHGLYLCGPDYALVRREFRSRRRARVDDPAAPLLVTFGGSDPGGWSAPAVRAAIDAGWPTVELLVGPAAQLPAGIDSSVTVIRNPVDVGEVFDRARAVVTAGGTSTWELLAMGQACGVVPVVPDQAPVAEMLGRAGVVEAVEASSVDHAAIAQLMVDLLAPDRLAELRAAGLELVDGLGAKRVVDTVTSW